MACSSVAVSTGHNHAVAMLGNSPCPEKPTRSHNKSGQNFSRKSTALRVQIRICHAAALWKRKKVVSVRCEKVVGIDLGTTNSAVAVNEGGKPTIVNNEEGQRTTSSVVAFTKTGERIAGQIAKRQDIINHENTSLSKDSLVGIIGRKYDEVKEEAKQVSFKVVSDDNGNIKLECPALRRLFAPEEISGLVV